jgi:thiamine transport system substrate-binding protein
LRRDKEDEMKLAITLAAVLAAGAAAAQDRPTLTVYTYDSFVSDYGPGPVIKERFEAECGCTLDLVAAGDGAQLLARLRLEGENTDADIALGLDTNLMAAAKDSGLFAPHGIAPPDGLSVPGGWEDATFLPYDWGWFAFVYDETRLPEPPTSFEALRAAPEDVTIIIQDPRTSTPGLGLLMWVKAVYGEDAPAVWTDLAPRIVTVTKGWWEAYSAFLEGEAAMTLSYTTSPAYHAVVEGDETKKAAAFEEGHYLQIEVAGKLAGTDRPDLADAFLAFMLSEGFQSAIPTTTWMLPAIGPAPAEFDNLVEPAKSLLIAPEDAPAVRAEALEEWLDALSR